MLLQLRQWWKQVLWWARIKLVYSRITLTRFTTLYFLFAVCNCIILVAIQGVEFGDNSNAVHTIDVLMSNSSVNVTEGLPVLANGILQYCDGVPGQSGTVCSTVFSSYHAKRSYELDSMFFSRDIVNTVSAKYHDDVANNDNHNSTGSKDSVDATKSILTIQNVPCAQSVIWLENVLQNEQQEDIVTLFFDFWLLSLSVVTILNESLPHLGASLAGHTLGTAWAAFRIASYQRLQRNYENIIVHGTCQMDFLASWWSLRNAVLILIFNGLGFLVMGFLSFKLFKVYATQSFSRVGASPQVNNIYKLVLVFSACLQLAAFFLVASASMWIDNLRYTSIEGMTDRTNYLIAVTITFVLWLPWLYLGWTSVRREVKRCFTVFTFVSAFFIVISALMFSSDLYRFIFNTWALFATVTITAFITLVATVVLGVWCRLNFGKGLSHFLQVTDALEGVDFTPVMFPNDKEKGFLGAPFDADPSSPDEKYPLDTMAEPIAQPQAAYKPAIKLRQSVYSEKNGVSMKLSYTPSLFQDRAAERAASCSRTPTAWSTRSRALTPSMRSSVVSSASAPVSTRSITPTPTIVVSKV